MEAKVQRWGNSLGIRIPSTILKSLNIKPNDMLNIKQEEDKIIVSVIKKNKISLSDRFKEYNDKNLAKDFTWDENIGREIW